MRIALDIRKIGTQGTGDEVYITNLVKALSKIDRENEYFLCGDSPANSSFAEEILKIPGDNFRFFSLKPSGKFFWTRIALPRFAKKNKIDLVHVQYITPPRMAAGIKLITTIHDVSFARFPELITRKDRLILKHYIPQSLKKAEAIIAVSNFTKKEILACYPRSVRAGKIVPIYNGLVEGRFRPRQEQDPKFLKRIKTKYALDDSFIFHISSLQPRKNVPSLIEAYRNYIHTYKDEKTSLVIGGARGYNYDKKIEEFFNDMVLKKRVKMIGYVSEEDLPVLYSLAKVYASPSFYEGFDLPLIENFKSGTPVIASNFSCHPEIIGSAGVLVDPTDPQKFAQKINLVLNDEKLRKSIIREGFKRAAQFTWKECAQRTLALYEKVVAKNK